MSMVLKPMLPTLPFMVYAASAQIKRVSK